MGLQVKIRTTPRPGIYQGIVSRDDRFWICLFNGYPNKNDVLRLWNENRQAFHTISLEDE